jgi:TM2 domain-containing membrane protein YozV
MSSLPKVAPKAFGATFGTATVFCRCMSQGSSGNVIAAVCSFLIPGLGQLTQGRLLAAIAFFVISGLLWFIWLGWLGHILACFEAAIWRRPR